MERLVHILVAFRQYLKQYHWLANSYEDHLLAERLIEEMSESLDDSIDRLVELALGAGVHHEVAGAVIGLKGALLELEGLGTSEELKSTENSVVLNNIAKFISLYLKTADEVSKGYEGTILKSGIDNAIFSISEDMIRRAYLVGIQLEKSIKNKN